MTREEAIEELEQRLSTLRFVGGTYVDCVNGEALEMAVEVLKRPERKTGKWKKNDNGTYSCSLCQSWIPSEQHYYAKYCLHCGAKMEGEE